jgi:hypothetical protein
MYTTAVTSAAKMPKGAMPVKLLKRIGSTTFVVNVYFSNASKETLEDKLFRIIEREVDKSA